MKMGFATPSFAKFITLTVICHELLSFEATQANAADIIPLEAKYDSIIDLQRHALQEGTSRVRNLTTWNKWSKMSPTNKTPDRYHTVDKPYDMQRLQWHDSPFNPDNSPHPISIDGHYLNTIINSPNEPSLSKPHQNEDLYEDNILVSSWSKRQAVGKGHRGVKFSALAQKLRKYKKDDELLASLTPDLNCTRKLSLCGKLPTKKLDCVTNCYLGILSLRYEESKFLYRLLYPFKSFAQILCPTFGSIYDEIQLKLEKGGLPRNTLQAWLASLGIVSKLLPTQIDFIKNAPQTLFNNLVKHSKEGDFDDVKSIIGLAESQAKQEQSRTKIFPTPYSNPSCKRPFGKTWITTLIAIVQQRPSIADIFLRGFFVVTKSLLLDIQYPLDGWFSSWTMGIKLLTGVDCSIVAYAEKGKPFKCTNPLPVDKILAAYKDDADKRKNPFSWMVCGAHQIDVPDWIKKKMQMNRDPSVAGRADVDVDNLTSLELIDYYSLEDLYYDLRPPTPPTSESD